MHYYTVYFNKAKSCLPYTSYYESINDVSTLGLFWLLNVKTFLLDTLIIQAFLITLN